MPPKRNRKSLRKKCSYKRKPRRSRFQALEQLEAFALIDAQSPTEDLETITEYIANSGSKMLDFKIDEYRFHVYLLDHKTEIVVGRATGYVDLDGKMVQLQTINSESKYAVYLERLDVNFAYQGKGKCADIVSKFIEWTSAMIPHIEYYELDNTGEVAGCRCYLNTFASHGYFARWCHGDQIFDGDPKESCKIDSSFGWLHDCIRFYPKI